MRCLSMKMGPALAIAVVGSSLAATSQDYTDCQQTEDIDRSIAACSRVVIDQALPAAHRATMYVRRGYGYLSKNDLNAAVSDFTEAIRLDPQNVYGYAYRAIAHSRKGDQERAIVDFQKANELDPSMKT